MRWLPADLGPGVTAFVTTRAGGVSEPPYDSLNLARHVGDRAEKVSANRDAVVRWLGMPVAYVNQVHGAWVHVIGDGVPADAPDADAIVTAQPGIGVAVMVADCVPVLLADAERRVIGVAHAGRRGLVDGVVPAALDVMVGLGARVRRIRAHLGPAICGTCYEVGSVVQAEVAGVVPAAASTSAWGTPAVDLAAGVISQLSGAGVRDVSRSGICTREDDRFYSYRRSGATGRFVGVVALEPHDTPSALLAAGQAET